MRIFLFIAVTLVVSLNAYGKKIRGVIISKGQSKEVTFDIKFPLFNSEPRFERLQYKIRYFDENGKKQTLRPEDADEVRFEYAGKVVRMISCLNSFGGGSIFSMSGRIFLKLEIDGPLKLYRYYYTQMSPGYGGAGGAYSPGVTYTVHNFIFQKGNGLLKQPKGMGWKKDMIDYFSDCPALRELIENKELKRKEVEAIVMYFNQHCGRR